MWTSGVDPAIKVDLHTDLNSLVSTTGEPSSPMATKCLASSCLQQRVNARVMLKGKNWKSICKVISKRCEKGESSNNIPAIHRGAPPVRWGPPAVPFPRVGWVPPNSYFGGCMWPGRSHSRPEVRSRVWAVPLMPSHHRHTLQATGIWDYELSDSMDSQITLQRHFLSPWALQATCNVCVCSCKNHSGAQLCPGCNLFVLHVGDTSLTNKPLPITCRVRLSPFSSLLPCCGHLPCL